MRNIFTLDEIKKTSFRVKMNEKVSNQHLQYKVGPLLVINGVITPISRVKSPQLPIYKAIYRAYNSTYNDRRGPPCTVVVEFKKSI